MPNVLLTNACNRGCEYCFARERLRDGNGDREDLTLDGLMSVADFLAANGQKRFSLIGGEPSLHPDFPVFVRYLLGRDFEVRVFTNGMWPAAVVDELAGRVPPRQLRLILNLNGPDMRSPEEDARQRYLLDRMAAHAILSVNLFRPDLDLSYVRDLYARLPLDRVLRISLSHPILNIPNSTPPRREDLPRFAETLVRLAEDLGPLGVGLNLDCGFTLCTFTDAQLGTLFRNRARLTFTCHPVVDIGPDLQVWPCFPLSPLRLGSLDRFETLDEIRRACIAAVKGAVPGLPPGVYEECRDCRHLRLGQCAGGCQAHVLKEALAARADAAGAG